MTDNKLISDFTLFLKNNRKTSTNTLSAYARDLSYFSEFLTVRSCTLLSASDGDILAFKKHLTMKGKSVSTISRSMSTLRSFYKFLFMQGHVSSNPAVEIKNDKQEKKFFEVLSEDEIDRLLATPDGKDFKGKRDRAMLEIMYATGMKVSELMALDLGDVNLKMHTVVCRSGNERIVMLYPKAIKILDDYLKTSRPYFVINNDENALFVNTTGSRMTRQGFWKLLKSYADKANINKTITPHTLRHSFATHLLQNGADIHDIKDILGHADISSTQVYNDFIKSKLNSSYLRFNHRSR